METESHPLSAVDPSSSPAGRREMVPWHPGMQPDAHPDPAVSARALGSWFLPARFSGGPLSLYVSGDTRPIVNRVVFAMARGLDSAPLWLDIVDDGEEPDALRLGWVPRERTFLSRRTEDLEPAKAVANLALWSIVRSDEPSRLLAALTDFVRLPPLIQEVLGEVAEGSGTRAVAVGNADRVEHLFRSRPDEIRWLLDYLHQSSVSLVIGLTGEPGANGHAFDAEFRVTGPEDGPWQNASIVCERARAGTRFPVGRRVRLGEIPGLCGLFGTEASPQA